MACFKNLEGHFIVHDILLEIISKSTMVSADVIQKLINYLDNVGGLGKRLDSLEAEVAFLRRKNLSPILM